MISIIAALSNNHVIGKNNCLPWNLPADLKHFKQLTMNKPIIMGRKTFESIGKPLPGRLNIIVTSNAKFHAPHCRIAASLDEAIKDLGQHPEVMVIGGAMLYQQAIAIAQRLYLTIIQHDFTGDTYFPLYDLNDWKLVDQLNHPADDHNAYAYSFQLFERTANQFVSESVSEIDRL